MQSKEAFVGFSEAAIDFPPTFKYDVLRYKRSKHSKSIKRLSRTPGAETQVHEKILTEIEETPAARPLDEDREDRSEGEQEYDGEAASVASTMYSTGHSKYTMDVEDDEREDYFYGASSPRANHSVGALINKSLATAAVHKAKTKWMSLIHTSSSPGTPIFKRFKHKKHEEHRFSKYPDSPPPSLPSPPLTTSLPNSPPPEFRSLTFPATPGQEDDKPLTEHHDDKLLMPPPPRSLDSSKPGSLTLLSRAQSTKSMERVDQQDEEDEVEEKGVYDTSHKKRVPSWYVRYHSDVVQTAHLFQLGAIVSSGNPEWCLDQSQMREKSRSFYRHPFLRGRGWVACSMHSDPALHVLGRTQTHPWM